MTSRWRRFVSDRSGTTAIEFAIAAPLFLAFVFLVVLGGWALHGTVSVRHALETASRQLSLDPSLSQSEMLAAINQRIAYLGDPNVTVGLTMDAPSGGIKLAHATAVYLFKLDVPFLNALDLRYEATIIVPLPA